MTLTPSEIRYLLVLMGCTEYGTLIRPGNFTGEDVVSLRTRLKQNLEANDG